MRKKLNATVNAGATAALGGVNKKLKAKSQGVAVEAFELVASLEIGESGREVVERLCAETGASTQLAILDRERQMEFHVAGRVLVRRVVAHRRTLLLSS